MFAHVAVHYPKPGHEEDLLASMRKVDAAGQGVPGLLQIGPWRDDRTGLLVGIAIWESREAFEAGRETVFAAIADDPLDEWWERPPDSYHLTPA